MIYRVIGRSGSGKTEYILEAIKKAHEMGKECIFLAPEQQSVAMERALCALLGSRYNLNVELLNFERLPDRVFRENGGITKSRADSKTISLFTALACENAKEKLTSYKNAVTDRDFIKKISDTVSRMEECRITPKALVDAASLIKGENEAFKEKLYDIAQIYHEYTEILKEEYADSYRIQQWLYDSLKKNNFFSGKTVFIDGYYNFTKGEFPIVEMIFKGAADTYISILYDKDEQSGIFDVNKETLSLTEKMGQGVTNVYPDKQRKRVESLSYLEKNLFSGKNDKKFSDDSVSIISCKTPYEESDCIANEIINLVKKGYRYKDIFVAARDNNRLDGFLDAALKRYKIPFYMAEKEELSTKELPSLILSFLEIASSDWSTASVIKYAKSSFSPLTSNEADLLSIYAECWKIRGKQWHDGEDWEFNPSGYKTNPTKRETNMLLAVNSGKKKLSFALEAHIKALKSRSLTVSKGVRTIYNHLIHIEADKILEAKANKLLEQGKEDEAAKISALWDSLMSILTTLHETAKDVKVTPRRLHDLIKLMMDEYKVGALPSYSDSIEVGNASIMRPSDCKVMIISGMNDGVFPASHESSGLFSNMEKEFLRSVGVESETLPEEFIKNEFLLFYNLCAAPTDKLILTFAENTASGGKSRMSSLADTVLGFYDKKCIKHYTPTKKTFKKKRKSEVETFSDKVSLTPQTPETLSLSASKIEKYLGCPFSYFCNYVLRLEKYKQASLSPAEAGTYVHSILEDFTKEVFESGTFKEKTDDEIKEFIDQRVKSYKESIFHGKTGERENYAFDKYASLLFPLLKNVSGEFASSGFVPVKIEDRTSITYPLTEKTEISLDGVADRIDVLEKDGKKYVRIVDYKTGKKDISPEDVKEGFEMQMLTYLFSNCKDGDIPAGVMYFLCGFPSSGTPPFMRNGIMLDCEEVKDEMKFLTDNSLFKKTGFHGQEVIEELKGIVEENVRNVGKNIIDGKMNISPTSRKKKSPCTYCSAKLYCRKKLSEDEE